MNKIILTITVFFIIQTATAQDTTKFWNKLTVDTGSIRFTVLNDNNYISFDPFGKITHFPKDSLSAIMLLYTELKRQFDNKFYKRD